MGCPAGERKLPALCRAAARANSMAEIRASKAVTARVLNQNCGHRFARECLDDNATSEIRPEA